MAETKSRSTLDTIANIAIILVCVIASVVLVNNFLQAREAKQAQQAAGPRPPEVKKGEQLAILKSVVPAGANHALVVALQPGCGYCNESMPFYKRLIDERNKQGSNVKVIAAVSREETKAEEQQKMDAAGVQPDGLVTLDFAQAKIAGTPTLLLVDNQGKVLDVWVGKVKAGDEDDVLETLEKS